MYAEGRNGLVYTLKHVYTYMYAEGHNDLVYTHIPNKYIYYLLLIIILIIIINYYYIYPDSPKHQIKPQVYKSYIAFVLGDYKSDIGLVGML